MTKRKPIWLIQFILGGMFLFLSQCIVAQTRDSIYHYLDHYTRFGEKLLAATLESYTVSHFDSTINVKIGGGFTEQAFTADIVENIYKKVASFLPDSLKTYNLQIITAGKRIEDLVPNYFRIGQIDSTRTWKTEYSGHAWVRNNSAGFTAMNGLDNVHIGLWQSHGIYNKTGDWSWQRPRLFCTTEDLLSQTIVIPYIIPMLENAGAIIYTPRDRNWQNNEVIVDNDKSNTDGIYHEASIGNAKWINTDSVGFAYLKDKYSLGDNPFRDGTARYIPTTNNNNGLATASWQPYIPQSGKYAVYVSYVSMPNSIDNAIYQVYHNGIITEFEVNQRIGGGTWVYLGTFDFKEGFNDDCKVVLINTSKKEGVVTADAVRFGSGYGNVTTSEKVSRLPRWAEAARYYAQWAGFADSIISHTGDDYKDDLYTRPYTINSLAGRHFAQTDSTITDKVPLELAVAFHTDAGYSKNEEYIGSLSICTTTRTRTVSKKIPKNIPPTLPDSVTSTLPDSITTTLPDSIFNSQLIPNSKFQIPNSQLIPDSIITYQDTVTSYLGISRMASYDLASMFISNLSTDLRKYGWPIRQIRDNNYCETREPEVPSVILEMLSHQNFADMCKAYDPQFKFDLARSIYKTILKYVATTHGREFVVQPLPVSHFQATLKEDEHKVHLSWRPERDPLEPSAVPQFYIIYTRIGNEAFDHGKVVTGTSYNMDIHPDTLYSFRIVACNKGGCSFPSETLSAYIAPNCKKHILIVNAFTRLEGPARVNTSHELGFDLDNDPGVQYGAFAGFCGRQKTFSKANMGSEATNGTGYSGNELEGTIIMGNTFDYPFVHGTAIQNTGGYSFSSSSIDAVLDGQVNFNNYPIVDLICGVQKQFNPKLSSRLLSYINHDGHLIITGANISNLLEGKLGRQLDIMTQSSDTLLDKLADTITDIDTTSLFTFHRTMNDQCYSVPSPTILQPSHIDLGTDMSLINHPILYYLTPPSPLPAAIIHLQDQHRVIICGFPFETIKDSDSRNLLMHTLLKELER
ncbi:MAG: xanthan lyase [Bacteroidaceae bacterium]|nr:xanthan lyase [Bacteroidaceae bacterium]